MPFFAGSAAGAGVPAAAAGGGGADAGAPAGAPAFAGGAPAFAGGALGDPAAGAPGAEFGGEDIYLIIYATLCSE